MLNGEQERRRSPTPAPPLPRLLRPRSRTTRTTPGTRAALRPRLRCRRPGPACGPAGGRSQTRGIPRDRSSSGEPRRSGGRDDGSETTSQQFELEARAFLDAHARRRDRGQFVWGQGSDSVGLFPERTPEQEAADLRRARTWAQTVFDAGFGWITGPEEYGGRGLPREFQRICDRAPPTTPPRRMSVYGIGLGMVAPTILAHATDEVKEAYLRHMYRGDIVACQLFSEPGSGSRPGRRCRPGPSATVTSGSSTGRRCGRRVPSSPTSARSSAAPIPTCPSTGDSPASSWTCTPPASRSGRCVR